MMNTPNDKRVWTPEDRHDWIKQAVNSTSQGGSCDGYDFNVLPKIGAQMQQDDDVAKATENLANIIYKKNQKYRPISLGFYVMLLEKIKNNKFIGHYLWRKIIVLIKGSTAQSLLVPEADLSCTDLDITIFIDPYCDPSVFQEIKSSLHIILVQTMSQYKKTLDNMLFLDNPNVNVQPLWGMERETIDNFKKDHIAAMEEVGLISPFVSNQVRNNCSRNSIVLLDSAVIENSVVRVEVPHFNACEKIPLRRTPIFCSYNDTIHNQDRDFNLYRLKFNCLKEKNHRVAADFIDINVLSQNDPELIDFWTHGRFVNVYDKYSDIWVCVPDLVSTLRDLWKLLNVYECPPQKREKRQKKYDLLLSIYTSPILIIPHSTPNPN